MDAAIVELDALPDPVGSAAEDHDLAAVGWVCLVLGFAETGRFVGRVHIGRNCLELCGAAVDPLIHGIDAELVAQRAHFLFARRPCHGAQGVVEQARAARLRFRHTASHADRAYGQCRKALIGKAHRLQAAHFFGIPRQTVVAEHVLFVDDRFDLAQEPRVEAGDAVDFLDREFFTERLGDPQDTVRRTLAERGGDLLPADAFEFRHAVKPVEAGFEAPKRLLHRFRKAPADGHDLADRLHRGGQFRLGALELFKREARDLGHDIVDGRLEAGRRRAGDLVGQLVQRVAHGQLRRDAGNRKTGGLGCERG